MRALIFIALMLVSGVANATGYYSEGNRVYFPDGNFYQTGSEFEAQTLAWGLNSQYQQIQDEISARYEQEQQDLVNRYEQELADANDRANRNYNSGWVDGQREANGGTPLFGQYSSRTRGGILSRN